METWLAQNFVHPGFAAAGSALVASPIIIHLINRMRFRRVRFAAMEFLLQSQQRNRRRLLIEQLLLLLLRILIVLAIVALLARLILSENLAVIGQKTHHVVLLDDSGSMRDRAGDTTAFEQSLDVVKDIVAAGARRPNTQVFTLMLLSKPDHPLFSQEDINDNLQTRLEQKLENLRCTHARHDLVKGLEAARTFLAQEKAGQQHLHVISDYRAGDWQSQTALAGAVRALDEAKVGVNLVRAVGDRHANLAVTGLDGDLQVAATGVTLKLTAHVKNYGAQQARDVRLSVTQDDQKLPLSIRFDKIEAGQEAERDLYVVFETARKHTLKVSLEGDALEQDNTRYLVVDVPLANPILIIDGDPSADEGEYLKDAVAAETSTTGFAPLIESPDYLRKHPLDQFRCIYMVNVAELPDDAIAPLEEYVREGGGLAWYLGELVKPAFYNDKLYRGGSEGLFPVPLAIARRELPPEETASRPDLIPTDHPVFSNLTQDAQDNPFISQVRIDTYIPVAANWTDEEGREQPWERDDNARKDGVSTIMTLRNGQPFMFEHTYGKGRVLACLSSAGPSWNNWSSGGAGISFVITQLDLVKYIARAERSGNSRTVGEPLVVTIDPSRFTEKVEIAGPDDLNLVLDAAPEKPATGANGGTEPDTDEEPSPAPSTETPRYVARYADTDTPGIYRQAVFDLDQTRTEQWIAYNAPTDESALELATTDQIQKLIGEDVATRVQIREAGQQTSWIKSQDVGQEVRRLLLIVLVLLLLAEQALAWRLSYHPTTAGATA